MSQPEIPEQGRQALVDTAGIDTDDVDDVEVELSVKDIGGIEESVVTFRPGVTILTGENATNRTSLLTALNGVLGGTKPTVRGDADDGHVALRFNPDDDDAVMFSRTYYHDSSTSRGFARVDGTPVCDDDAALVDTFATLLEDNAARRAVERGEDIRSVLMRPVDTDAVERDIREKTRERDDLQDRLDEIDRAVERETALTEKRERLTDDLEETDAEIESMQEVVDEYEAGVDMAEEAEELVNDLESKREEKRDIENRIEVLNAELDGLEEEKREIRSEVSVQDPSSDPTELGDHGGPMVETTDFLVEWQDDLGEAIQDLQRQEQSLQARTDELNSTIEDLTRIITINQNAVENVSDIPGITDTNTGDVTDQLDPSSQQIGCWTCGSTVEKNAITDRTQELQNLVQEKRSEVSGVESELEDVRDQLTALRETRRERKRLQDRLDEVKREKQEVREEIAEAESDLEAIQDEITELETEVEETAELRESDLLDAHQELNELQYNRGRIETQIEDTENELEEIQELRDERESVESDLESVREDVEELRTHVADLERTAVEAFNDHMESILDRLQYKNIARVWIEREVPDTGDSTTAGTFDLHIVRETDGSAYEDRVETLSESEREVVGLIVALAGYLVHDVAEHVPFILLDSVEAVDANRLVDLVEYFEKHTAFLTVALLPEDAAEFPGNIDRITADELTQASAA